MIACLKRDVAAIKKHQRLMAVMLFVWLLIFLPQGNLAFLAGMCGVLAGLILSISVTALDNELACATLSPGQLVGEKYLFGLVLTLLCTAFTGVAGLLMSFFMAKVALTDVLVSLVGCLICCLFYIALLLPFLFKMDRDKAKTITVLCFVVPYGLLLVMVATGQISLSGMTGFPPLLWIILAVCLVLYLVSYMLSRILTTGK